MTRLTVFGLAIAVLFGPVGQNLPNFSVESELVQVHMTVKDRRGAFVSGLSTKAFAVFDNDRPQTIRFFFAEDSPATVGLIIDDSGSLLPMNRLVVAAARAFVEGSNPLDEVFALTFSETVRPALPVDAPFTNDPSTLANALIRPTPVLLRTGLYDAVEAGMEYARRGTHDRHILVVVSDGDDNASITPFEQLLSDLQSSDVVVFAVVLTDPVDRKDRSARLRQIAQVSGGDVFRPRDEPQVSMALQEVSRDIRHAYALAFEPTHSGESTFHRIRVDVRSPDGGRLDVRTRTGYVTSSARARDQPGRR